MIEFPPGKPFRSKHSDDRLAAYFSDRKNKSLKQAFEKAAGVTLLVSRDDIYVCAKLESDVPRAIEGLKELGAELRTIAEDRFEHIISKIDIKRHRG